MFATRNLKPPRSPSKPDKPSRAAAPSFPRTMRRDPHLNITARLAWLMTSLAYRNGYASMPPRAMADELDAPLAAVQQARKKLVGLGLFAPPRRWRYDRVLMPGEDRKAYWRRVRAEPRLDLATRCGWVLADATKRGPATLSLPEIGARLGASKRSTARAVNRVLALGHFHVVKGGGRGSKSTYARHGDASGVQIFEAEEDNHGDEDGEDLGEYYRRHFPQRAGA